LKKAWVDKKMNIDIKNLEFIDKKLREICLFAEEETRINFTVTSIFRMNDDGVHGTLPVRGIDLGCRNEEIGTAVENLVNDNYIYDPKRPHKDCAMYHDNGNGPHIHLQVHPNTIKA